MVRGGRGQLLLVAGFLVAVVVVASAVLLNGIVVPGDAKTEGVSADVDDAYRSHDPLRGDLARLFEATDAVGEYGEPLPYAESDELGEETVSLGNVVSPMGATRSGTLVNVSFAESESVVGSASIQWGTAAALTDDGSGDWTVLDDAETVESVWLNASRTGGTDDLVVRVTNGSADWELRLDGNRVEAEQPDGTTITCQQPGSPPTRVYSSRHSPVSQPSTARCPAIQVAAGVDPPYDVEIANGDQFTGEYAVTGSGATSVAGDETKSGVVVNPAFSVSYLTSDLTYESTFAVYNGTGR